MGENQIIHSFDATFSVMGEIYTTEKYRDLYKAMAQGPFISRGAGVSYPLASAGAGIRSIDSSQFNRILEFDSDSGVVKVESGISLGVLLRFLASRGWWLPTIPGHPAISIGGCLAANVHGKSQYHSGLFSDSVLEFELFHPMHGKLQCKSNDAIFKLTMGGFGLTGHVLSVTIKAKRLPGKSLVKKSIHCFGISECIEVMTKEKDRYDHVYSWNNLNLKDSSFGAGYVYCEKFESESSQDIVNFSSLVAPPRTGIVDKAISLILKNQVSNIYSLKEKFAPKTQKLGILAGAFPINGKEIYHRIFGKNGLLESQIIIPREDLEIVIEKLSRTIRDFDQPVALGSLKLFKGQYGNINFAGDGVCLALNVPSSPNALWLFKKIDQICIEHSCRPNIAKDSRLSQEVIEKTYPEYSQFKKDLLAFDPKMTIQSALRARLGL